MRNNLKKITFASLVKAILFGYIEKNAYFCKKNRNRWLRKNKLKH